MLKRYLATILLTLQTFILVLHVTQQLGTGVATLDPKSFNKYVTDFEEKSGGRVTPYSVKDLEIEFAELDYSKNLSGAIGLCYFRVGDLIPPKIQIDAEYWRTASDQQRWSLMFHELGHCVCNRSHTTSQNWIARLLERIGIVHVRGAPPLADGCPASLMHPEDFWGFCVQAHREYYIEEMFASCEVY